MRALVVCSPFSEIRALSPAAAKTVRMGFSPNETCWSDSNRRSANGLKLIMLARELTSRKLAGTFLPRICLSIRVTVMGGSRRAHAANGK
jgi:hypothetical protein